MTRRFHKFRVYFALIGATTLSLILSAVAAPSAAAANRYVSRSPTACAQPPANINLSTISNAQLAFYGLPLRPTSMSEMPHWTSIVSHSKHRACKTSPAPANFPHSLQPATNVQPLYSSQENTGNWAGVVAVGNGYERVEGSWQVSETHLDKGGYDAASWVGIGGDPNDGGGVLAQAGSESTSQKVNNVSIDYYYLWYEEIDPSRGTNQMPPQKIDDTHINFYDSIETIVDDNYSFPGQTYIYVGDFTANVYFGQTFTYGQTVGGFAWEQTNQSTAEWIVEKAMTYLDLSAVPGCPTGNSHCVTFTQDHAVRNHTDTYIDALPTHSATIWMNSTELAYPGPIHNSGSAAFFNTYLVASCSPGLC